MSQTLSAEEAAAQLGVSRATLYAYVSRGLIRSEEGPAGRRHRRYRAEDVHALVGHKEARRDPARNVQEALHWGAPLLDSALTLIEDGHLYYRGEDALTLSRRASLEEVAALLWTGDREAASWLFAREVTAPAQLRFEGAPLTESFALVLAHGAAHDLGAHDLRPEAQAYTAARVLKLLFAVAQGVPAVPADVNALLHQQLASRWFKGGHGADTLRAALVLCADHELNISSFTARCVASSGANLYHAALGGLCALQGPRHGLSSGLAYELLANAETQGARTALQTTLAQHGAAVGFGHRLYPQGDPRGRELLNVCAQLSTSHPALRAARELQELSQNELGEQPNIDFGLALLGRIMGLTAGQVVALFALGRTVGWLAHALESASRQQLLRPRARYVGPRPFAAPGDT